MDHTDEEIEDLATMRALRLRLRACADARVAECEAMPAAKNWLDMLRQIKVIAAADRMVVALYSPPRKRPGSRRPPPAKPSPPCAVDGDVSDGAACRMTEGSMTGAEITQSPVAQTPSLQPRASDAAAVIAATARAAECINAMTHACARLAGIWPDGARFDPADNGWRRHALTAGLTLPADDDVPAQAWLQSEILSRANEIARQSGRLTGLRFDGTPYAEGDADYWSLSANADTAVQSPAAHEGPGPSGLPWWIVRPPP